MIAKPSMTFVFVYVFIRSEMEANELDIFWQSFFGFLEKIGPIVVPLIAVYIGWRFSQKTYVRQLQVDTLNNKFDALREIKSVIGNVPPDLDKEKLIERLSQDEPVGCGKRSAPHHCSRAAANASGAVRSSPHPTAHAE